MFAHPPQGPGSNLAYKGKQRSCEPECSSPLTVSSTGVDGPNMKLRIKQLDTFVRCNPNWHIGPPHLKGLGPQNIGKLNLPLTDSDDTVFSMLHYDLESTVISLSLFVRLYVTKGSRG